MNHPFKTYDLSRTFSSPYTRTSYGKSSLELCRIANQLIEAVLPERFKSLIKWQSPKAEPRYQRIVMVQFKPDIDAGKNNEFKQALHHLAHISDGLIQMDCGAIHNIDGESELSKVSPDVRFGDFISIWTFASEQYLRHFIHNPEHKKIAAHYFKPVVANRYVINHRCST